MPSRVGAPVARGYLLNGKVVTSGSVVEIRSPYDQSVVGAIHVAGKAELEEAISAAVQVFETTKKIPAYERQSICRTVSQTLVLRKEEFAHTMAQESGKPIKTARAEVERAIFTFEVAAGESVRIGGEYLPLDLQQSTAGMWGMVKRFPIGPIAAITPFNFPLNLVAHKMAPAIAAGCTMVLKPAPQTPLSALLLAEVVQEAGWPAGALNVLPLSNEDAAALVSDDRLKLLSFTGSAKVGWQLKSQAGKKKVVLELGGNAGVIIHSDADIAYSAQRCAVAGFSYSGQSCISVQRILVHRDVYQKFLDEFVGRVKNLKTGDPMSESTDVGPLIREDDAIRAVNWVQEAVSDGARLLTGGQRHGSIVEPTVLTNTNPQMRVNCEEIFAPVKTVEPYDDFSEAIARINDTRYGLQAGVFTNDARLLFHAYEQLQVGGVIAGDVPTFRIDHMPYGGVKDSGLGREGLRYAMQEMTEPKLLVMNLRQ